MKILIATYPFGQCGKKPLDILHKSNCLITNNFLGRRLKENEVGPMLNDIHGVIAGTEPYNDTTLKNATDLKVISRVGVGLDNIDFNTCQEMDIIVTYTPEAPANAVADLAICQILNLLRHTYQSHQSIIKGEWDRIIGKSMEEVKIGVLGIGRIGIRVVSRLRPFGGTTLCCDIDPKVRNEHLNLTWVNKQTLFSECDIVTIHIPLNETNYHCVSENEINNMKLGSYIVNTSRGQVLDEEALVNALDIYHLNGAALDVFETEPYHGILTKFDNVLMTAHMGSSSNRSRYLMELGAAKDCLRVLSGKKPINGVNNE